MCRVGVAACCLTFSQPLAWRLYPLSQNTGISKSLILFWKLIFPYGSSSSVFYVAVTKKLMLLDSKKRQEPCLDRLELNEGCKEQPPCIFVARQTSPSPRLALMDVLGSACKQMVAALVMGSFETVFARACVCLCVCWCREVKLFSLTFE